VVGLARQTAERMGRKFPVMFDRAYEDLVHDQSVGPLMSPLLFDTGGFVYEVGTLSKIVSPALRIGYLIGTDGPFMRALVQKTSDTGFSAPLIAQEVASCMLDQHIDGQLEKVRRGYREKAAAVTQLLDAELGGVLADRTGGQAGFYFYLTFKAVSTREGSPFFRYLARTTGDPGIDGPAQDKRPRVIYVPGEYCVHPRGRLVEPGGRQLRLSYGFEDMGQLRRAISYMKDAAAYALHKEAS